MTINIRDNFPIYHQNWLNRLLIIDRIAVAAEEYAGGLLLDVGCGTKQYQSLFSHRVDRYVGFDLGVPFTQPNGQGPDLLGSALGIPLPGNTFDTVVSFQVLEHVPEPQTMLGEIARLLKPGGYLILMAPQMWHLHEVPHDYFRYTRFGLVYLAEKAGLRVVKIQPISGFWIRAGLVMSYRLASLIQEPRRERYRLLRLGVRVMITLSNLCFKFLDRLWPRLDDPINNLLVAQKCS
jgi:SAM-dependent methyltransferase